MPRLSVVITSIVVILVMLAVALYTRFSAAAGRPRSVSFTPGITISTSTPNTVAVILEAAGPDGVVRQVGWGCLGNTPGLATVPLDLPASGQLTVRWAIGKQIALQASGGGLTPINPGRAQILTAGIILPEFSAAFLDDPQAPESTVGTTALALNGGQYELRIENNTCRVISSIPPPPAPPPPPPASK